MKLSFNILNLLVMLFRAMIPTGKTKEAQCWALNRNRTLGRGARRTKGGGEIHPVKIGYIGNRICNSEGTVDKEAADSA